MEDTINKINTYNKNCQLRIDELIKNRNVHIELTLELYTQWNAKYRVGDFLKFKRYNHIIKVNEITSHVFGDKIIIMYSGKKYKKVKVKLRRSTRKDDFIIPQDYLMLHVLLEV